MAHIPNVATPGQQVLYLPHRLFRGTPQAPDVPNPLGLPPTARRLPFELPGLDMNPQNLPQETRCRRLHVFEGFSTGNDATSDPNIAGAHLDDSDDRMEYLMRCSDLNLRLYQYADPNPNANANVGVRPTTLRQRQLYERVHPGQPFAQGMQGLTTNGTALTYPFPSSIAQYDAIRRLAGWFIQHDGDLEELAESEPSIQDHVKKQLLDPLGYIMRVRVVPYGRLELF